MSAAILSSPFAPLESPAACGGDEGNFLMGAGMDENSIIERLANR
jgi:hypothetical protein